MGLAVFLQAFCLPGRPIQDGLWMSLALLSAATIFWTFLTFILQ